jgi:hypothetical protein
MGMVLYLPALADSVLGLSSARPSGTTVHLAADSDVEKALLSQRRSAAFPALSSNGSTIRLATIRLRIFDAHASP